MWLRGGETIQQIPRGQHATPEFVNPHVSPASPHPYSPLPTPYLPPPPDPPFPPGDGEEFSGSVDAVLPEHVAQVEVHASLGGQTEPFGCLGAGEVLVEEAEHLQFRRGWFGKVVRPGHRASFRGAGMPLHLASALLTSSPPLLN